MVYSDTAHQGRMQGSIPHPIGTAGRPEREFNYFCWNFFRTLALAPRPHKPRRGNFNELQLWRGGFFLDILKDNNSAHLSIVRPEKESSADSEDSARTGIVSTVPCNSQGFLGGASSKTDLT